MYNENQVVIRFYGKAKTGKSTVAEIIRTALADHGISVEIHDKEHFESIGHLAERIEIIKKRGTKFVLELDSATR